MFADISKTTVAIFSVILIAAIIVDTIILFFIRYAPIILQNHSFREINIWYNKFGLLAVVADVLSIVIGIILARFIYPFLFTKYSLILFLILICFIQVIHDVLFYLFFTGIPRNKSAILDVFKDYANEVGIKILFVDGLMMVSTVLLASYLATLNTNSNIIILIVLLYILPYVLYSIKPIK